MFNGKTHYKWSCSIAMLNYQRVSNLEGIGTPLTIQLLVQNFRDSSNVQMSPWAFNGLSMGLRLGVSVGQAKSRSATGWWFFAYPSEKYEFVSWDDCSQLNGKILKNVPNHQPGILCHDMSWLLNIVKGCILVKIQQWTYNRTTWKPRNVLLCLEILSIYGHNVIIYIIQSYWMVSNPNMGSMKK